jgi:predicted transglutaminase-like cysteine proteinase
MARAIILSEYGDARYKIQRIFEGRDAVLEKRAALVTTKTAMQSKYAAMPEETDEEILAKAIVKLQISSLTKQIDYIDNNFPEDILTDAYCVDFSEGLTGEVGTIDIPGEVTEQVHIRPGFNDQAVFDGARDGGFYPSIALGHWTTFLNRCIYPGWQKWKPTYRYAWIVPNSIDYANNTCAVTIQPASSSQQGLDINQGDGFGAEIIEEEREISYFYQPDVAAYPGFEDFCARNPDNPICSNTEIGTPIELSNDQYDAISEINWVINNAFAYESDQSGFSVGEYFNIMNTPGVDTGDCEDFALTKMNFLINAGIIEAKNIQLIFCDVIGYDNGGHAVAGIQTINHGFIILDNRFDQLMDKTFLSGYYAFNDFQLVGYTVVKVQRLKGDVHIEYMGCNEGAFSDGDEVVVEFTGQDWTQPKVIGFKDQPKSCGVWSMFGGEPLDITAYRYSPSFDVWTVKADELQHFSGLYFFTIPDEWAAANDWQLGVVWPIHIKYEPIVTRVEGNIFSFGGWFDGGDYLEDRLTTSFAIDTCERFDLTRGVWSRRNKDAYVGRSCGAGWVVDGKSFIAGGAFYDDRINSTRYPHIDLEPNYVYGDYEKCNGVNVLSNVNIEPTPDWNAQYSPDFDPQLENWDKLFSGHHSKTFVFETGEVLDYCTSGDMWSGAHSYPPGPGVPYATAWKYDRYPTKFPHVYYIWYDFNPQWGKNGKRWYENQLFGECLCFDDETNAYTQKTGTTPIMMMGSFQLGDVGFIVGGTTEEISDIIRSADADGITDKVKKYHNATNVWTAGTGFSEERLFPSGFEAGGKGYAFSGYSKTDGAGSTEQLFGHERVPLDHLHGRVHPFTPWHGGGNPSGGQALPPEISLPTYGYFPAETVSLFCTNTMHEYNNVEGTWTKKNDASTPIGNCRYREFYNWWGTIRRPYYYTLTEDNNLVQIYFEFTPGDPGYYWELENPGPYDDHLEAKLQHVHRYPAAGGAGVGYVNSMDYMASYNPITDSYTIKDDGLKDHLSGGMV